MLELAYILSIILMLLLPVILAAGLRRLTPAPWLLFSLGALTFTLSQVVHIPLNDWLADLGWLPGETIADLPLWRTALTAGLTAGLCEELARAAGYLFLRKYRPAWLNLPGSLMLGLGHGGIESMVFGGVLTAATLSALLPLRGIDLTQLSLTSEQLSAINLQLTAFTSSPWLALQPLLERLLAISAHVTLSLMVWKAFARGKLRRDWIYILVAILYHAAIDYAAVWTSTTYHEQPFAYLGVMLAVLLPGWAWAIWTIRRHALTRAQPGPLRGELAVFWVATLKELRQAWSTKRILVVWAVFLAFGMLSPLLARFTFEIVSSMEGAEMFAGLIPPPTTVDAMVQYLKNLSQFGFILAVLLAMGAVVGEKERRVAPMILSKPMARWAFILSKFAAQFLVYSGAFFLSALAAYYYTLFLFGPLEIGSFLLAQCVTLALAAHLCRPQPAGQHPGQVHRRCRRHWAGPVRCPDAGWHPPPLGCPASGRPDDLGHPARSASCRPEPGCRRSHLAQRRGSRAGRRRCLCPGAHPAQPGAGCRNLRTARNLIAQRFFVHRIAFDFLESAARV